MTSWGSKIPGLPPAYVAKVDEVVERRERLKRELKEATEQEIALYLEVSRMNLWSQSEGKLFAPAVEAMAKDIVWGVLKSGPAVRKTGASKTDARKDSSKTSDDSPEP
jgi:hypothetical protein